MPIHFLLSVAAPTHYNSRIEELGESVQASKPTILLSGPLHKKLVTFYLKDGLSAI